VITEQPTTPQTCSYSTLQFVIDNDACIKFSLFSNMDVSQGSSATPLRCGEIVNDDFIANLLVHLSVKKNENRSTFGEVMDKIVVPCFFDSQCTLALTS